MRLSWIGLLFGTVFTVVAVVELRTLLAIFGIDVPPSVAAGIGVAVVAVLVVLTVLPEEDSESGRDADASGTGPSR